MHLPTEVLAWSSGPHKLCSEEETENNTERTQRAQESESYRSWLRAVRRNNDVLAKCPRSWVFAKDPKCFLLGVTHI